MKIYTDKPEVYSNIPAFIGEPAVSKIDHPIATCPKLTKAQKNGDLVHWDTLTDGQKLVIATTAKQARASESMYRFSVADLNSCFTSEGATTPALETTAKTTKCKDENDSVVKYAALY